MARLVPVLAVVALVVSGASLCRAETPPEAPEGTLDARLKALVGRPGGLTSDEVGRRAETSSFDVRARQKDVEAASAGVDQALVAYFPRLTLLGRYTRLSPLDSVPLGGGGGFSVGTTAQPGLIPAGAPLVSLPPYSFPVLVDNYLLQASLTVPISDYFLRISQAYGAAEHTERGAQLNERATRLKVASDAKLFYYAWVRAKLQVVVGEQALAQSEGHLKDAKAGFEARTVSKADVLRVESQVASSELLLLRARNLADLYEHQVRVALHDDLTKRYEIGEDVQGEAPSVDGATSLAAMIAEAMDRRLEVRALDETAWSLKNQAKSTRGAYYPRLDAFGDLIYANPNNRIIPQEQVFRGTWDVGLSVTWTPTDVGVSVAQSRSLEARAASTEAQKAALVDTLRVEVMREQQAFREAELSLQTTGRGLAAAEESYRVRKELFAHGRATSVELTDAETDLTRARLEAINARLDLRVARVRLLHALGRDVPR